MKCLRQILLVAATAVFALSAAAQDAVRTVTIDSGALAGSERGGVQRFFGIPFAAPPVGDLRWRAPQAVKPWDGVRPATAFGPVCRQTVDWIKAPQSEDCLSLNIWAPAKKAAKPYPVMLWIHGGGYRGGTGSQMGPEAGNSLVAQDVILVTINYRLGLFGFFAHPELSAEGPEHASGNQAILDQIAALKWVQRNIARFGGDPSRVTIFGESAGSSSVTLLTISPQAKGLFHRAIAESGTEDSLPDQKSAEQRGADFVRAQNAPHLADLRKMDGDTLIKRDWQPTANQDSYTLPEQPAASFSAGHQNAVPLLLGWNADEGVDLAPEIFGTKDFTAANHEKLFNRIFQPQVPAQILALYPGKTDAEAIQSIQRFTTDMWGLSHFRWATWQFNTKTQPAYLYFFVHSPAEPKTPCGYGCKAGHGAEIRFAFDQLFLEDRDWTTEDRLVATQMIRYWTNFAKTGNPNSDGLPQWTAFDGTPESAKRFGSESEIKARGQFPDYRPYLTMGPP